MPSECCSAELCCWMSPPQWLLGMIEICVLLRLWFFIYVCVLCLHDHLRLFLLFHPWRGFLVLAHTCTVACLVAHRHNMDKHGKQADAWVVAPVGVQQGDAQKYRHAYSQMCRARNRTHLYPSLFAYSSHLMHAHTPPLLTQRSPQWFWALMPGCQSVVDLQDATPRWAPLINSLSPVIHSCDWGWEWRRPSAEKWNREDPGGGLERPAHHPPKDTLEIFYGDIYQF